MMSGIQQDHDPVLEELQKQVSEDQQIIIITGSDGQNQYFIVNKDQDWSTLLQDSGIISVEQDQQDSLLQQLEHLQRQERRRSIDSRVHEGGHSQRADQLSSLATSPRQDASKSSRSEDHRSRPSRKRRRSSYESELSLATTVNPDIRRVQSGREHSQQSPCFYVQEDLSEQVRQRPSQGRQYDSLLAPRERHRPIQSGSRVSGQGTVKDTAALASDNMGLDLECVFDDLRAAVKSDGDSDDFERSIVVVSEPPPIPPPFNPVFEKEKNSFQNVFLKFLVDSINETRSKFINAQTGSVVGREFQGSGTTSDENEASQQVKKPAILAV